MGSGFPFSGKLQRLEMAVKGHKPEISRQNMAKSDAFFIRAKLKQTGAAFVTTEIDLGSFVNLGISKSTVLRVHAIEIQISDDDAPEKGPFTSGSTLNIGWDLTTQEQTTLVTLADKSVVASGRYMISESTNIDYDSMVKDQMPQTWRNGYLIAVDSLWLSSDADQSSTGSDYNISIVMECTLENATQASSTALALSQQ